ncbi:hypothetical protein [Culicoidibacter larvae]|uniref:Uncharacterized protein n=1 Tax=Culicoidibacter larvae TaxID=2579976 RepID=A0A5R8Q7E0_9FIRM|nr:hypothetical protein [Culicoidibacter larvae]TLG70265.1 hypothetical protein FEZ08_12005 [Culicoidibacter larvae]
MSEETEVQRIFSFNVYAELLTGGYVALNLADMNAETIQKDITSAEFVSALFKLVEKQIEPLDLHVKKYITKEEYDKHVEEE